MSHAATAPAAVPTADRRVGRPTFRFVSDADRAFLYELFVAVRGPALPKLPAHLVGPLYEQQFRARQASLGGLHAAPTTTWSSSTARRSVRSGSTGRATRWWCSISRCFPECRGFGVGTWLLDGLIDESEYTGLPVELSLRADHPARPSCERLGFRVDGHDHGSVRLVRRPFSSGRMSVRASG